MNLKSSLCNNTTIELDIQDFMYISMLTGVGYFLSLYFVIRGTWYYCHRARYNVSQPVIRGEYV